MALHRLLGIEVAVPDPDALGGFFGELGLTTDGLGGYAPSEVGTRVAVRQGPMRQLVGVELGCADDADLAAISARAEGLGLPAVVHGGRLTLTDPTTRVEFRVQPVDKASTPERAAAIATPNAPGATVRRNARAAGVHAAARAPRRLGHVVIGSPDPQATRDFLVGALGCKVSDELLPIISFLRCSTDHHNLAVVHTPVPLLQHYSWECDDVDHVGATATALLRREVSRSVWGLGRHFIGSNFYWYLRDPSGSFIELYSDLDVIDDDDAWEQRGRTAVGFEHIANAWGPDIPPEFIAPHDLPELEAAWAKLDV